MKVGKLNTERFISLFLIVFLLNTLQVQCKEYDINAYKGKVTVSKNYKRVDWKWWGNFKDKTLLNALKKSIDNNFDVQIAGIKAEEAKNYINSAGKNMLPYVRMGTYYRRAKHSNIGFYGNTWTSPVNRKEDILYLPLQFNYEVDFLGKNRDEKAYFAENRDYVEFSKNFIIQSTLSQVSSLYFNIAKNEKLITLYSEIKDLEKKKLDINLEKYDARLVAKPEILILQKKLNLAEEQLTSLKTQNEELKNNFYLLVFGDKEKASISFKSLNDINIFYDKNIEISTSRIANRPDVLMAEKQIKMANLDVKKDVKKTKKALFPKFEITGDIFQITRMFNDFFGSKSLAYGIGYGAFYELFKKGNNRAELKAKKSLYKQALKSYEKAIVSSITDVNNSLFYLKSSLNNYDLAKETSGLDEENMDINKEKLDMSLIAYEDYIDAKERFILSKIAEYKSKTECLIQTISLYKALGGNV